MASSAFASDLDVDFYRLYYGADPAIAAMTDDQIEKHYRDHGKIEGRWPRADLLIAHLEDDKGALPADFDEEFYLNEHLDVRRSRAYPRYGAVHFLQFGRHEGRLYKRGQNQVYGRHMLDLLTNRVYDLPVVAVSQGEPARINVLVPAFEFKSMSAGFFGVFQVARFIATCGFRVRLVMFDNFYWNEAEFREKLRGYPGMEDLFDELEVLYIGSREQPLLVSPRDNCVATVWYSAWFAQKIMGEIGNRPFLYLIQDYETNFFPGSSNYALAESSYSFNYHALFSTEPLMQFFLQQGVGNIRDFSKRYIFFNNAAAASLKSRDVFLSSAVPRRRLALYSRPVVHRNMFELAGLALCQACSEGVFSSGEWEFFGIGLGDAVIDLGDSVSLNQLPRMNLAEYQELIATFDVGLSLMASPHPSLLPFDLGGSGAIVVTNSFRTKQQAYFTSLCGNVIAKAPTVPDLVNGLREAVARVGDRERRFDDATAMRYPRTWEQTFKPDHVAFMREIFADSISGSWVKLGIGCVLSQQAN